MKAMLFLLSFILCSNAFGQTSRDSITVKEVRILGHKKTRSSTIFREMSFKEGDKIALNDLSEKVDESRASLMNTGLFADLQITYVNWEASGNLVTFVVTVVETWYIYPVPIFRLADRNFNVWWTEQNRDLNRVNIGGRLSWRNFTGRRDKLKLGYQYGYTREVVAGYDLPYLNKAQNIGINFNYTQQKRREQNYQTINNEQIFYRAADDFVYHNQELRLDLSYRPKLYANHLLRLAYRSEEIADTIAQHLNPNFFREGQSRQRFLTLGFEVTRDKRDVRNYPWKGSYGRIEVVKDGLGIFQERDGMRLFFDYRAYIPFGQHSAVNLGLGLKYSPIRKQQPFLDNRAIGFGSYGLSGYQFYVVDGLDMLILRSGIRRQIGKGKLDFGKLVFIEAFRYIPWRVVLAGQLDQGWANAPFDAGRNPLSNTWLVGGSVGFDVILYYDMVFGIRYHHNRQGEGSFLLGLEVNL